MRDRNNLTSGPRVPQKILQQTVRAEGDDGDKKQLIRRVITPISSIVPSRPETSLAL